MANIVTKKTVISDGAPNGEKAEKSQTLGYIIYFLFGVIEILLIFRFVFKLTGASPVSSFVSLIYSLTQLFIIPFEGIFRQATTTGVETTAVLEPATLVAIVVYAVLAWGITKLVIIMSGKTEE